MKNEVKALLSHSRSKSPHSCSSRGRYVTQQNQIYIKLNLDLGSQNYAYNSIYKKSSSNRQIKSNQTDKKITKADFVLKNNFLTVKDSQKSLNDNIKLISRVKDTKASRMSDMINMQSKNEQVANNLVVTNLIHNRGGENLEFLNGLKKQEHKNSIEVKDRRFYSKELQNQRNYKRSSGITKIEPLKFDGEFRPYDFKFESNKVNIEVSNGNRTEIDCAIKFKSDYKYYEHFKPKINRTLKNYPEDQIQPTLDIKTNDSRSALDINTWNSKINSLIHKPEHAESPQHKVLLPPDLTHDSQSSAEFNLCKISQSESEKVKEVLISKN